MTHASETAPASAAAPLTRDEVAHVARLARLGLDDDELGRLTAELGMILSYVRQLDEVDTEGVEPTTSLFVPGAPLREDGARAGLDRDEVLGQAPRPLEGGFGVPGFVEG
ncbi:MAG TPA: Asp-tRNA(Asn)/Glu-tRNA(Gln) amidotransferase subunit GatC [Polyangiaceae bacterium]|nr:Asp-tRNA(Asn)/Glu-tRNA(Gln) amidotransferase subunit GatC [Polyangiaceae bacterium]